jgi:hypothetical protein
VSPGSVERALPGLERDNDDLPDDVVAMLTPTRSKDMALNVLAGSGVARTGWSLAAVRAAMLARHAEASSALSARPDALTERDRWMRVALELIGCEEVEPPAPGAAPAIDDLGMEL